MLPRSRITTRFPGQWPARRRLFSVFPLPGLQNHPGHDRTCQRARKRPDFFQAGAASGSLVELRPALSSCGWRYPVTCGELNSRGRRCRSQRTSLVAWAGKWVSPIIRFYCPIRKQVCELLRGLAAARDAIARLLDVALIEIRDHTQPGNHCTQNYECCIAQACTCHGLILRASPEHHAKRNIGIRVKTFSELNSMVNPCPLILP